MIGPKRKPQEFGFKAGDSHLIANDVNETLTAFAHGGQRLWQIPALCRGQGGDKEWKAPRTDTPPGLYRIGTVWNDFARHGNSPNWNSLSSKVFRDLRAYGWITFDMVDLEGNEDGNGRAGIALHGGGTALGAGAWAPKQPLLPTWGCIRIHNIELRDKILPLVSQGTVYISVFQEG